MARRLLIRSLRELTRKEDTMQKIVIKATDAKGETMHYIRMTQPIYAEMAFYALTHDAGNQDCNWALIVEGEMINWHYPLNK